MAGMRALGKFALLIVMTASGLLLLVGSVPVLAHLLNDVPLPERRAVLAWSLPLAGALILGTALWLYRRLDRRQQPAEQRRRSSGGKSHDASRGDLLFEARSDIGKPLLLILMVAVLGIGTYLAAATHRWVMFALFAAFTAFLLLLAWQLLAQFLRPGPMLRMDARCIDHAMYGPVPWSEVVGMHLQSTYTRYGQSYVLMLGVRDAARYLRNLPPPSRWLHRRALQSRERIGTLPVPLDLLRENPELIHRSARILCERAGGPLLTYWHPGMGDKDFDIALRMRAIEEDMDRMAERMQTVPDDADAAQVAELETEVQAHIARNDASVQALLADLDAAREQRQQGL